MNRTYRLCKSQVPCTPGWVSLAVAGLALTSAFDALGQGCITSRGLGMPGGQCGMHLGMEDDDSAIQASVGYRWLHSDRMFIRDVEQRQRSLEGSQEINDSHFIDFGLTYQWTPRISLTATVPFSVNDRSQVVRALNVERTILDRFHTHSAGAGDLRFGVSSWLWNPTAHPKGNISLGLGVVAPSGDRDVQDAFAIPTRDGFRFERHAVDPSIQLGSGGWGATVDVYAYHRMSSSWNAYLAGTYTVTPEEKYSPAYSLLGDYSIPDNYVGRLGFEYSFASKPAVTFTLGGRVDGVPVHDLVGGSDGFRRPGYAVSIEPGVRLQHRSWAASLTIPVAVYRNREQSTSERALDIDPVAASFADFLITASISRRF